MMIKYRVHEVAKDFKKPSKDVVDLLGKYFDEPKKHMTALQEDELNTVFETFTKEGAVESFDEYFNSANEEITQSPKAKTTKTKKENKEAVIDDNSQQEKKVSTSSMNNENNKNNKKPQATQNANTAPKAKENNNAPKAQNNNNAQKQPANNNAQKPQNNKPNNTQKPQQNNQNRPAQKPQANQNNNAPKAPQNNQNRPAQKPQNQNNAPKAPANNNTQKPQNNRPNNTQKPQQNNFNNQNKPAQKPQANQNNAPKTQPQQQNQNQAQNPNSNRGALRHIDTRTSNVNLDKYNPKYEQIAPANKMKDTGVNKQKINQRSRDRRGGRFGKRETEAERLKRIAAERAKKPPMEIAIPEEIKVADFAAMLKVTSAEVIKKLMPLGIMATVNDMIDYDTAELIGLDLGAKIEHEVIVTIEERIIDDSDDNESDLIQREPVVCVMGHVDHGKTSLLDAIRNTSVIDTEAGGITQHIGAYRVRVGDAKITFLDTPGHEAFTAMRARGAMATDIAVLVVAADDGIMPQTIEAINHAKAAGVKVIVAINKMDKPDATTDRVMQQLTEHGLVPEEWGGDIICVPVSAKQNKNIDKLLEIIQLEAEMMELRANPNRRAKGIVIESRLDKSRGPIATLLVQNGTLNMGDVVIAGSSVGRVRVMTNHRGDKVKVAGPSVPVEVMGLDVTPSGGDIFDVVSDERLARELVEQRKHQAKEEIFKSIQKVTLDNLFSHMEQGEVQTLNIIIKADVQGSVEAIRQSLLKLSNEEVRVNVIHGAVGAISESDVMLASAADAIIVGFNVRPDNNANDIAQRDGIDVRTYSIIYQCIEEISSAMKGMLAPKTREVELGKAEVRQVYKISNVGAVSGSYILEGKITRNAKVRIIRENIVIAEDEISSLKRFKDDVKDVAAGYECGITLVKFNDIKEGDIFEAYIIEEYRD